MTDRQIQGLQIDAFGDVYEQDDGRLVLAVRFAEEQELGLLMAQGVADEILGALIHRPQSGYHRLATEEGRHVDVTDHEVRQIEEDAYAVQISGEGGAVLTLRLGSRRLRRLRDTLTAHLLRHEAKRKS